MLVTCGQKQNITEQVREAGPEAKYDNRISVSVHLLPFILPVFKSGHFLYTQISKPKHIRDKLEHTRI